MTQASSAFWIARPHRHRRRGEHGAGGGDLGDEEPAPRLRLGARQAIAGEVAEARHGKAADGPSLHLDQAIGLRIDGDQEGFAAVAKARDRAIEAAGRFRLQPVAEGKEPGALARCAGRFEEVAGDQRRRARRAPGDQPLVLAGDQRLGAIRGRLEVGDLVAERLVFDFDPVARADERDRAEHREGDRADEDGVEHQLDGVDLTRKESGAEDRLVGQRNAGRQRGRRRAAGRAETGANRDRSPAMLSHAPGPLSPSAPEKLEGFDNATTGRPSHAPRIAPM